jgi:outer membrane protein assembly factor BamB
MKPHRLATFMLLTAFPCLALAGDDWPGFRGPASAGHSAAASLPLTWGPQQNIRWRMAIHGKAWSSPIVSDGKVWMTTANERGTELGIICVDLASGGILIDRRLFEVQNPQYCHPFNSYASPTPAAEPGRVYVTFGSPGTACLDAGTGQVLWERRDLECNHFRAAGSSPVIWNHLLLMNFDGSDHQFVVALDKNTGRTVWRTDRSIDFQDLGPDGRPAVDGDFRKAFSTPVIAKIDGAEVMISLGSKCLYGYDPATGKELWRMEYRGCHSGSPTPVVGHGLIFTCMGLPRGELWAIRPGGGGGGALDEAAHVAWKIRRNVPTRSSVLLIDDLLYLTDDGGIITCVEARTGVEVWRGRIRGNHSASPLYAAGRIYFFGEDGTATIIAPGRELKVLAENRLEEGFMASAAPVGKALILRTRSALYRIEEQAQPASGATR